MAPMNKPEWFQLAESDGGLPRRNAKRGFRALALSIPLMAIGIGVVVAHTSNEAPAIAETTSVAVTQSPTASTSTPNIVASWNLEKISGVGFQITSSYSDEKLIRSKYYSNDFKIISLNLNKITIL